MTSRLSWAPGVTDRSVAAANLPPEESGGGEPGGVTPRVESPAAIAFAQTRFGWLC